MNYEEMTLEELKQLRNKNIGFDPENEEKCIEAVNHNVYDLKYVRNQTYEVCLEAVKKNGLVLTYVREQTPEICLEAIKENPYSLQYVREQTEELCLAAVKNTGRVLQYVIEQTPEICLAAVKQNGFALQFVIEQTPEICLAAINQNVDALSYVKDLSMICKKDDINELCNQDNMIFPSAKEAFEISTNIKLERNNKAIDMLEKYIIERIWEAIYYRQLSVTINKTQVSKFGYDVFYTFINNSDNMTCTNNIIPKLEKLGYKCNFENSSILTIEWELEK